MERVDVLRSALITSALLAMLGGGFVSPAYADTCTANGTGSGNWSDSGTWDCSHVPNSTDSAVIFAPVIGDIGMTTIESDAGGSTTIYNSLENQTTFNNNSGAEIDNFSGLLQNDFGATLTNSSEGGSGGIGLAGIYNGASITNAGAINNGGPVLGSDTGYILNDYEGMIHNQSSGGILNYAGAQIDNLGVVNNEGIVTNNSMGDPNRPLLNTAGIYNAGQWTNNSGGELDNNGGSVLNAGTMTDTSEGSSAGLNVAGIYNSNSALFMNTGTLNVGTADNTGDINNDATSTFDNQGTININALASDPFNGGEIDNYGTMTNEGSIVNYSAGDGSPNGPYLAGLYNIGNFTNSGSISNQGYGSIQNDGTMLNDTNGFITNSSTFVNSSTGTLTNNGTITNLSGSDAFYNSGILANASGGMISNTGIMNSFKKITNDYSGTIDNGESGLFRNSGQVINDGLITNEALQSGNIVSMIGVGTGMYNLAGTITNNLGGTITNTGYFKNAGVFENDGTFNTESFTSPGTFAPAVGFVNTTNLGSAKFGGTGITNGDVENQSQLGITGLYDNQTINGNLDFGMGGFYSIELDGGMLHPHDMFAVMGDGITTGLVTGLDWNDLVLTLYNDGSFMAGDSFEVMTAGSFSSFFDVFVELDPGNLGLEIWASNMASSPCEEGLCIYFVNAPTTSTPEPSAWGILGLGLLGLLRRRFKR